MVVALVLTEALTERLKAAALLTLELLLTGTELSSTAEWAFATERTATSSLGLAQIRIKVPLGVGEPAAAEPTAPGCAVGSGEGSAFSDASVREVAATCAAPNGSLAETDTPGNGAAKELTALGEKIRGAPTGYDDAGGTPGSEPAIPPKNGRSCEFATSAKVG